MLLTRQRIIWQLRKRLPSNAANDRTEVETSRTATVERIPDPNVSDLDAAWREEWQGSLMAAALQRVKRQVSPRQFQIFDLYVLQNWSADVVARTLSINVARVYLAKHRVGSLLAREVKELEARELKS